LQIVLAGDSASARREFSRVEQSADKMGKKLDREGGRVRGFATVTSKGFSRVGVAATGMAAAGAGAATLLAKSFLEGATSIQESLSKNEVLFGQFAGRVEDFSDRSAKAFGISKQAALEATGTFGNLFVALDIGPKKSAGMSVALTKLAADLASFNNATPEEALEAIRSGLVGETEPLRRFGVNLNDATLRAEALRMGLVKNTKEALEPQTKALAVNSLLFKQTEKAQGDFRRTSDGLANQQRILKAQLADTAAELGGRLMPFALKAVSALNGLFDSSSKGGRAIEGMGRIAQRAAGWLKNAWEDAVNAVRRFVNRNRADIDSVIDAFRNFARFIQRIFQDVILPTVRDVLPHMRRIFDGIVQAIRGLVRIVTGIINGDWARVWDGLKDIVSGALRAVRGVIGGAWELLKGVVTRLGGAIVRGIGNALSGLWRTIRDAVVDGVRKGVDAAKGAIGDVLNFLNPFGDGLGNLSKAIGDGVGKSLRRGGGGGVNLMGADPDLFPFAAAGARMGLRTTSGIRPGSVTSSGNTSWHSSGDAIDMAGSPGAMMNFFRTMKSQAGSRLRELIYTPGGQGIKDGKPYTYSGTVAQDHYDHVHLAFTGPFGDGIGQAASAARRAGFRGQDLITAIAIAGPESGYRNNARLVTSAEDSRGMWQINTYAHPWARGLDLSDPNVAARAAHRVWRQAGGFSPWTAFTSGSYRSFLARARAAVSGGRGGGGGGGPRAEGGPSVFGRSERGEIPTGPGARLGMEGQLAREGVREARARASDNLGKLIESWKRQREIKKRRLRTVTRALKGKMRKARRIRLLGEQAQLVEEIDALNESIAEYSADQAGGATTITEAEELDAGVATGGGDTGGGGGDNGAAQLASELAALRASIDASRKFAEQVQQTESFVLKKYLADVLSGQIVGYGVVPRSFTPGSGVEHAY
jgi:hypothetical protein